MRADRLLSLLMLLQTRGRLTAAALAAELEVSERTIYRDLDALSAAGIPVYAERGPGGGCALLDSYRTSLTGLTQDEARALFMLSVPAPLAELGVSQELRTALLKLSAALPGYRRQEEASARARIHLDSTWWFQQREPVPHLATVQQALWADRLLQLTLVYRAIHEVELQRVGAPYGLVAKTSVWYLVWSDGDRVRADPVSSVVEARALDQTFERPADFDLVAFWHQWCRRLEADRSSYPVTARVAPDFVPFLVRHFGRGLQEALAAAGPPGPEGWLTVTLPFENLYEARAQLLSFGRGVEVLEPLALRLSVLDFARQTVALYEKLAG
jgi:predicted DNA-binding transcriptional regulator YafY